MQCEFQMSFAMYSDEPIGGVVNCFVFVAIDQFEVAPSRAVGFDPKVRLVMRPAESLPTLVLKVTASGCRLTNL